MLMRLTTRERHALLVIAALVVLGTIGCFLF
jgi:hypothetical protein